MIVDTRLLVALLDSRDGTAPGRLEGWVTDAVQQADGKFDGHSIGFVLSTGLLKEYEFRVGKKFGMKFFRDFEYYLHKFDRFRWRIKVSEQEFLFGPSTFSPQRYPGLMTKDKFDRKLPDLIAYLLRSGSHSDKMMLFGSTDRSIRLDIERMRARKQIPNGSRLKLAGDEGELRNLIADD